ncbi:hypothetical protein GCM10007071_28480 [Marinobacter zhanjiangensis]|uniref:Uncharacterized protein n=1 Tax=Marinobacter zhanjiangensis TaxID=578215 RepID=A0ABQ3B6H0_9GAMM|nr:hypothetical protein GCM10007071_28480 [Marinobacter zhanjiangensis]
MPLGRAPPDSPIEGSHCHVNGIEFTGIEPDEFQPSALASHQLSEQPGFSGTTGTGQHQCQITKATKVAKGFQRVLTLSARVEWCLQGERVFPQAVPLLQPGKQPTGFQACQNIAHGCTRLLCS